MPFFGRWLVGAMVCLFFFYLTFEFTVVSGIPLMTEIIPAARATMMAAHMALIALGRSLGDILAPYLFTQSVLPGIAANAFVAIGLNILALFFLTRVKLPQVSVPEIE